MANAVIDQVKSSGPIVATGRPVRVGVLIWSQYTDWAAMMAAGSAADDLGYDAIWGCDHLMPIKGNPDGPIHEALMTLAGWAATTRRARLGLMVAANTFRHPALLLKMVTALDHMSGGRAVLGLGAGWFELEHRTFGLDFGAGIGERLDRLDEAAAMIRTMLDGRAATSRGPHYAAIGVRNEPPPLQSAMPLLIGGAGERRTLATVARYADAWNIGVDPPEARRKDEVLREWCVRVGRDESEIERTIAVGSVVIRNHIRDGRSVVAAIGRHNGGWDEPMLVGSPAAIVDRLGPFIELGFRTLHIDMPAPFDRETMERFAGEVKPALQASAAADRSSVR